MRQQPDQRRIQAIGHTGLRRGRVGLAIEPPASPSHVMTEDGLPITLHEG